MSHEYPSSIEQAANLLDEVKPGWANQINIDELNMNEPTDCIIGQLYRQYDKGMLTLFGDNYKDESQQFDEIFGTHASSAEWTNQINQRLAKSDENNFVWALAQVKADKKVKLGTWQNWYLHKTLAGYLVNQNGDRVSVTELLAYSQLTGWVQCPSELMVAVGNTVKHKEGDKYLVSMTDINHFRLINMRTGNRWHPTYNLFPINDKFPLSKLVNENELEDFILVRE
jgi:hypothetical protein